MLLKINRNPSSKELRQFGLTLIVGFGIIGSFMYWRQKPTMALCVWGVSTGIGLFAILIPRASKVFYLAWMGLAVVMGGIMTRIILSVIYFLVLMPVALFFRCIGRDALRLQKKPKELSNWVDLPKITDIGYYKRLF